MDAVTTIAARAIQRGPRCGQLTVIAIDGPAGSGKTTLATRLAAHISTEDRGRRAHVLAMDDLYPGWGGLREAGGIVADILRTLCRGEVARYRRYDWHAGRYLESHDLHPSGILLIEGVGSVRPDYLDLLSHVVMVREPDPAERLYRGLARDGQDQHGHWVEWMKAEQELHREVGLELLADTVVDGTGRLVR